jgi:hypothetical protein
VVAEAVGKEELRDVVLQQGFHVTLHQPEV